MGFDNERHVYGDAQYSRAARAPRRAHGWRDHRRPLMEHRGMMQPTLSPWFRMTLPFVVRPKEPKGFTIETVEGVVVASFKMNYSECQFRLSADSSSQQWLVGVDANWVEC